ncbi:MAG TPA: hypothetical protein VMD29_04015 [Terracidiphilus sp.]|nr:hypothetical protein [Terracidiphilus sp.]
MIVIADTSPLNYFLQLGLIPELEIIFGELVIPEAVHKELADSASPNEVRTWALRLPQWVRVHRARTADPTLPPNLGAGETEAINLALELNAARLLIDDLPGRRAAQQRGIPVTGTLTIAWQAALISNLDFEVLLDRLHSLGFRASEEVIARVRREYNLARAERK